MKINVKTVAFLGIAILALGVGAAVATWPRSDKLPTIAGFVYPQPRVMSPITLVAHDGSAFTLDSLRGKWSFVYFGYSHCPDECPTTLAKLARVQKLLAAAGIDGDNQYIFVSVDPKRDTPRHLAKYVKYFDKRFIGVTGTPKALAKFTQEVGVVYSFPQGTKGNNYSVSHSSAIALFDPDARLHAVFTAPHKAKRIAKDFRSLRDRWAESAS